MRNYDLYVRVTVVAVILMMLGTMGCAASGERGGSSETRMSTDVASRRFFNTTISAVQPIADSVFRQYYVVDAEASSEHEWVSQPTELTEQAGVERIRDALTTTPNRRRQLVVLRLIQKGPHVLARCRAQVQRLDTAERAAFSQDRGDDRPTDTPIDRRGATSVLERQEWVDVGRDRQAERLILDGIKKQLAVDQTGD